MAQAEHKPRLRHGPRDRGSRWDTAPRVRTHPQRGRPGREQDGGRGKRSGQGLETFQTRLTNPHNERPKPLLASHGLSPLWAGPQEHCG